MTVASVGRSAESTVASTATKDTDDAAAEAGGGVKRGSPGS